MVMAKPRRNVKFAHRQQGSISERERRESISSDGSQAGLLVPGSPSGGFKGTEELDESTLPNGDTAVIPSEYEKKKQSFITRTIWTFVMIAVFFISMAMGHIYMILIVTVIQILTFKEVIALASVPAREKNMQFTKALNWYFLVSTVYYLYGESVIYYFKHIIFVDRLMSPMASHHRFISFMLYILGFVFFVGSLKKGHYKFQFTQFAWTHMALYLVVVQAHFIMNNIFEGMIWFFMPASLVITNDIFAYICGITFGRTQLIKLSPKKTVEGFVGAWVCTIIFGLLMTNVLMRYKYFICPVNDLGANIFTSLECTPNPVFLPKLYTIPLPLHPFFGTSFTVAPIQFHILAMATFASLIAPFGGFFASGIKRTFKIKDFGDTIPGHGGITDRMDCQFIMGFFSYMYYHSFIATDQRVTVGIVLQTVIEGLSEREQLEVVRGLQKYLVGQGSVSEQILQCWNDNLNARAP